MVINLDEANEPGTHWVAFYAPNQYRAWYFDSFGDSTIENIKNYVKANGFLTVQRQIKAIQHPDSTVCGYYAIYFIYCCSLNLSFPKIEKMLISTENPDKFVVKLVRRQVLNNQ
jgi:hypothetical protein